MRREVPSCPHLQLPGRPVIDIEIPCPIWYSTSASFGSRKTCNDTVWVDLTNRVSPVCTDIKIALDIKGQSPWRLEVGYICRAIIARLTLPFTAYNGPESAISIDSTDKLVVSVAEIQFPNCQATAKDVAEQWSHLWVAIEQIVL